MSLFMFWFDEEGLQTLAKCKVDISLAKSKEFAETFQVMHHHKRSTCPISFALEVFGDRWTLLVIRDLVFMGKKRFSEFHASTEGIATNVLSDRLQTLQDQGIIGSAKDPQDGRRVLYSLTEMGLDLIPSLVELVRWGSRHDPDTGAPKEFLERIEKDREGLIAELVESHRQAAQDLPTETNG